MAPGRQRVAPQPCQEGPCARTAAAGFDAPAEARRVRGPSADEVFFLCQSNAGVADPRRRAETAYESLIEVLDGEGVSPEALVSETVYLPDARGDAQAVLDARGRVFGAHGTRIPRPATTLIGQPPLRQAEGLEIAAVAVVPHGSNPRPYEDVDLDLACGCEACRAGAHARVVRLADQRHLYAGGIHGSGQGAFEQAYDMFGTARELLSAAGLTFGDVVRTWIYLRDIDRDYDEFNRARRAFFADCGIERKPASTGVGGSPHAQAHDFQLALYAIGSPRPLTITPMSSSTLNEAWTYGADFSRGLKVTDANKHALYVSGTASIGESGESVAAGDFAAQADRMLRNIEALLAAQGATFADIVSGVTYLKNASDAQALRAMFRSRGFDGFPCVVVEAPLCRPELLCETEVLASLSLAAARE